MKQKNIRCNGTFCMLAKPLWLDRSCFFFLHSGNLCKYYLLFRRKCSYTYQLYTYIYLLFTARLMGTYFTYCGGRRKKKSLKQNVQKNVFPVNMEIHLVACFCYTWIHVVQLSTSVKTLSLSFFYIYTWLNVINVSYITTQISHASFKSTFHHEICNFLFQFDIYFIIPNPDFLHNNTNRGDDHDNVTTCFTFFFIWCHFVYLECFW